MIDLDCVKGRVYDSDIVFNTVKEADEDFFDDFLHLLLTNGFEAYNISAQIRFSSCQKWNV